MPYIWEEYSEEKRFVFSERPVSPYMEVWDCRQKEADVNVRARRLYAKLFPAAVIRNAEDAERLLEKYREDSLYKETLNLILHFLAQTDHRRGLTKLHFQMALQLDHIRAGAYGAEFAQSFARLAPWRKRVILQCMAEYDAGGQRQERYTAAVRRCFPVSQLYLEECTSIVHVYIAEERTPENENVFAVIEFLFKDIGVETQVMWRGELFGIIGDNRTMVVGQTALV